MLRKGRVIGSVHGVSAVIPLMRLVDLGNTGDKIKTVDVGSVSEQREPTVRPSGESSEDDIKWDLSHLDEEKRGILEKVLFKMKDVFSKNDADIGDIKEFQMPIHVVDDVPVTAAYRKIPPHLYREVKSGLRRWT